MTPEELSERFLAALAAFDVVPTAATYDPNTFTVRRGLLFMGEENPIPLKVSMDPMKLQDMAALEGVLSLADFFGELFGKVIKEVTQLKFHKALSKERENDLQRDTP